MFEQQDEVSPAQSRLLNRYTRKCLTFWQCLVLLMLTNSDNSLVKQAGETGHPGGFAHSAHSPSAGMRFQAISQFIVKLFGDQEFLRFAQENNLGMYILSNLNPLF